MELSLLILVCIHKSCIMLCHRSWIFIFWSWKSHGKFNVEKEGAPCFCRLTFNVTALKGHTAWICSPQAHHFEWAMKDAVWLGVAAESWPVNMKISLSDKILFIPVYVVFIDKMQFKGHSREVVGSWHSALLHDSCWSHSRGQISFPLRVNGRGPHIPQRKVT